jgi:hypothetical protein
MPLSVVLFEGSGEAEDTSETQWKSERGGRTMKKSLTILMALTLIAALSACSESPMAVDDELLVETGEESVAAKGKESGPIKPPDPEVDPGDGAGGGGGRGGDDVIPREDL